MSEEYDYWKEHAKYRKEKRARILKMLLAKRGKIPAAGLIVLLAALSLTSVAAVGFVTDLIQTIPAQSTNPPLKVVTSECPSSVLQLQGPIPTANSSGYLLYSCSPTVPAFEVVQGTAYANFTLPAALDSVAIVTHISRSTVCNPQTPGYLLLTPGVGLNFQQAGAWDLCEHSNSFPSSGVPEFTIAWLVKT